VKLYPDALAEYVAGHPGALYAVSLALVGVSGALLVRSVQINVALGILMRNARSDAARAASEALGG
jgi:hypothetical protein